MIYAHYISVTLNTYIDCNMCIAISLLFNKVSNIFMSAYICIICIYIICVCKTVWHSKCVAIVHVLPALHVFNVLALEGGTGDGGSNGICFWNVMR